MKLIDTAGIRDAKDEVEKIGIAKSREIAKNSDLMHTLYLLASCLKGKAPKMCFNPFSGN